MMMVNLGDADIPAGTEVSLSAEQDYKGPHRLLGPQEGRRK